MLLVMKDIRKEQREEQHITSLFSKHRMENKQNNAAPKTIPNTIVYNGTMPHQSGKQIIPLKCLLFILFLSYSNGFSFKPIIF